MVKNDSSVQLKYNHQNKLIPKTVSHSYNTRSKTEIQSRLKRFEGKTSYAGI